MVVVSFYQQNLWNCGKQLRLGVARPLNLFFDAQQRLFVTITLLLELLILHCKLLNLFLVSGDGCRLILSTKFMELR